MPTFMAKINMSLPGCSGHLHQSLWDLQSKENLFYDPDDVHKMSPLFKSYLAGQMALLPDLLPFYAPTINSYKRLVEGHWAPTRVTWGVDNRTVAMRIIPGSPKSTRVEMRVTGSDINPYLAMSAAIASGLYGIENGLSLDMPETTGNGYAANDAEILPYDLAAATEKLAQSEIAHEILGDSFVKHFVQTRRWEARQAHETVTDWELKRYLELV
jgi:glutamine synthetase